jgi:hypothetical protein
MLIQIADAVALHYQTKADAARVPLATYLQRQLTRFAEVPAGRALVLTGEALEEVDRLLGLGSTQTPLALLEAIRAWAGITIGGIRLEFTPAQLAEIAYRAEKQGKTPEAIVQDIVSQMEQSFFNDTVPTR